MFTSGMSPAKTRGRPFTVIVEGNIGSGKTTFLNHFNRNAEVCVLAEPIELWRNCKGQNLLALMYEDIKRWSFTFQSYVQLTMLEQHTRKTSCPIKLMERSIYSARYCFVEKMLQDGLIHGASAAVIDQQFQWIRSYADVDVDLIVYLRTTPEVVYERMMQRNRAEEKSVSFEYLKALHDIHEDWLFHKTLYDLPAQVVVLDANLDKEGIIDEYRKCEPHILDKIMTNVKA
ncbi:deoxynucleoside kinase-like [Anthonomus grandis grandis]|uniref:deoxynucleoside kinase-like n=1 Tax=Anthonomus grandis grandis TaxID=2921223 RepID=UPI002166A9C7|nr:deoxynucleoside kinase-like [Anthonomus grandis grandis]